MVNAPCAAAHTRASQARPKPRGAHGPIADPERPPWNAHQLGGSAEPPNSPTPVKWIGQGSHWLAQPGLVPMESDLVTSLTLISLVRAGLR